jgi:hypothetical protein
MPTGSPAVPPQKKPSAIRDSQSTRRLCLAATTHARAVPVRNSSTAMGHCKYCTERHPAIVMLSDVFRSFGKLAAQLDELPVFRQF